MTFFRALAYWAVFGGIGPFFRSPRPAREQEPGPSCHFYRAPDWRGDPVARRRRGPRRLDLRPGGCSPGAADRPDPAFAKKESATSASRRRQRVARLPVGAAAPRQGIKTSPKCQRESTAETCVVRALWPASRAWIVRLSGISGRAGLMLDMTRLTHCGSRLCIAAGETLWFPGVQPPEAHGLVNLPSAVG